MSENLKKGGEEPFYIAQTGEPGHLAYPLAWMANRLDEAWTLGARHSRFSSHHNPPALLVEGWTQMPADEGEPRWSFTVAT